MVCWVVFSNNAYCAFMFYSQSFTSHSLHSSTVSPSSHRPVCCDNGDRFMCDFLQCIYTSLWLIVDTQMERCFIDLFLKCCSMLFITVKCCSMLFISVKCCSTLFFSCLNLVHRARFAHMMAFNLFLLHQCVLICYCIYFV